eukprot:552270-Amphidinium_carterae.1
MEQDNQALQYAGDALLEDELFASEAKKRFHLLKITMLSGRSTVVASPSQRTESTEVRHAALLHAMAAM